MMSQSELGVPETSYSPCIGATLTIVKEAATKVVRPRSDRQPRCTEKD